MKMELLKTKEELVAKKKTTSCDIGILKCLCLRNRLSTESATELRKVTACVRRRLKSMA